MGFFKFFYLYIFSLPCSNEDLRNFHDSSQTHGPYSTSGHHPRPKEPKEPFPAFSTLGGFFSLYFDFIQQKPKLNVNFWI